MSGDCGVLTPEILPAPSNLRLFRTCNRVQRRAALQNQVLPINIHPCVMLQGYSVAVLLSSQIALRNKYLTRNRAPQRCTSTLLHSVARLFGVSTFQADMSALRL